MTAESNNILPPGRTQWLDPNGAPLNGGKVYTFAADGLTPKTTWEDSTTAVPNDNPVGLDSSGMAAIWGQGQYVFSVFDSNGNQVSSSPTQDPVASLGISAAVLPALQATTTAGALAALGAQPAGVGLVPVGVPLPYAGPTAPTGWALCFGQAVSRSGNPNLFAALGSTWGSGDGSTTFNLPDLRGNTWAGVDAMGGTAANRLTTGGLGADAVLGLISGSEMLEQHNHALTDPGHFHIAPATDLFVNAGSATVGSVGGTLLTTATTVATTGITLANTGTGGNGNVQPVAIGNWIIQLG